MKSRYSFRFTTGVLGYPILFLLIIWMAFWAELRFGLDFKTFGIYPRTLNGSIGVFFSVFIHGSLIHLYHNSIPLFVMSVALFYFYRPLAWRLVFWGIVISGALTWCIGKSAYHIGSSGFVYVLMSFLLFKGLLSMHYRLISLSLIVVFLYGGMLWYIFPIKEQMSWEGHLSGFVTGILLTFIFRAYAPEIEVYDWENEDYDESQDSFLQQFDSEGNFIESPKKGATEQKDTVNYYFKED